MKMNLMKKKATISTLRKMMMKLLMKTLLVTMKKRTQFAISMMSKIDLTMQRML